jgi:hypothetical protein
MTTPTTSTPFAASEGDAARWAAQIRALVILVLARVPVILWGAPGAAKTSIVEWIAAHVACAWHTSIAALNEPPEYGGYPSPVGAVDGVPAHVAQLPVGWVLKLARAAQDDEQRRPAVLFLDELSNGAPATRAAAMRGVLDGIWGEHRIPRLAVVAASNPEEQSESGYRFSAALANRFCHIKWSLPALTWAEAYGEAFAGGLDDSLIPSVTEEAITRAEEERVRPVLSAFAHFRPDLFSGKVPENQDAQSGPWPSPRTWTMASRALAVALAAGEDPQGTACRIILHGLVEDGAMRALLDYWQALDLPDPEALLRDPSSVQWPARGDQAFAILQSVSAAARRDLTEPRWCAAWQVFGSAASNGRAAFAASAVRSLAKAGREKWGARVRLVPELDHFAALLAAMGGLGAQTTGARR